MYDVQDAFDFDIVIFPVLDGNVLWLIYFGIKHLVKSVTLISEIKF